jgi:multiple sugar transport system substrate-binding protein
VWRLDRLVAYTGHQQRCGHDPCRGANIGRGVDTGRCRDARHAGRCRSNCRACRERRHDHYLLVISSFTSTPDAAINQSATQYQQAHPGTTVTVQSFPASDFHDKLITAVKAGQGPDVASIDSAWVSGLAAANTLATIDDRFAPISDQFLPGPAATGAYLGKQFAVPWYTNNVGLYWNRKLFQAAGLSAPPTTWQELVDQGKKLTSGNTYGVMLGSSGFGSFLWFPFAWQNGAALLSDDGKSALFDSPEGQEAWQFYADLYLTQKIVPDDIKSATTSWDQYFAPFIQERVAMMMTGDWGIKPVQTGAPNVDFAIAPLPKGKQAATVIGGYNLAIPSTSKNQDAAWGFLQFLTSNEQEATLESYGRLPARQDISGSDYAKQHPLFQAFVDQGPVGRARATVPQWDQIENTVLADAWDSVVQGQSKPADALSQAAQKTNDLLNS